MFIWEKIAWIVFGVLLLAESFQYYRNRKTTSNIKKKENYRNNMDREKILELTDKIDKARNLLDFVEVELYDAMLLDGEIERVKKIFESNEGRSLSVFQVASAIHKIKISRDDSLVDPGFYKKERNVRRAFGALLDNEYLKQVVNEDEITYIKS